MESGTAFVDARGAIWLPAAESGPGPLRRRAEIVELKQAVTNSATARHNAATHHRGHFLQHICKTATNFRLSRAMLDSI